MATFLDELVNQLKDVNLRAVKPPEDEVETGEKVIGEASDEVRCLWGLRTTLGKRMKPILKELTALVKAAAEEFDPMPPRARELMQEIETIMARIEPINELMWSSICLAHPKDTFMKTVGLREGWKVVAFRE